MQAKPDEEIREIVRDTLQRWRAPEVVMSALWADPTVAAACAGSKRTLCRALGGFGDCPGASGSAGDLEEWTVSCREGSTLWIKWNAYPEEPKEPEEPVEEPWGQAPEVVMKSDGW